MMSTRQAAAVAGVSPRRIQQLAGEGRIPGAQRVAGVWLIPDHFTVIGARRRRPSKIRYE